MVVFSWDFEATTDGGGCSHPKHGSRQSAPSENAIVLFIALDFPRPEPYPFPTLYFLPVTISICIGKLIRFSGKNSRTLSLISCATRSHSSLLKRFNCARTVSDISERIVQNSSTEIGASSWNLKTRSEMSLAPASFMIAASLPSSAKRKASWTSGAGGAVST